MSDEYTPSTDDVRQAWMDDGFGEVSAPAFDRWLESVRAEERERIARNIVRELGEGRAADLAREGA